MQDGLRWQANAPRSHRPEGSRSGDAFVLGPAAACGRHPASPRGGDPLVLRPGTAGPSGSQLLLLMP